MRNDIRGLDLTTDSDAAVAAYDDAVGAYFQYRTSAGAHLKRALEADPAFTMAQCLRGYFFMLFGSTAFHDKAGAALAAAESHAEGATWRETTHIAALRAWLAGDLAKASAVWDRILVEHPLDLLALRLQHFTVFWMGRSAELRDAPARVLDRWDESIPGYGNVLGMHAFGLEECGDYGLAEARGKRAVEIDPDDLWAVHAVAHVLEMQGRLDDGIDWLDYPSDAWDDRNPFRGHLWWHRALFFLERGDYETVLALYDRSIRSEPSDFYLDIQNAASLLARLDFCGVDVGDRWRELADHVETRLDDHVLAFTDAHAMMALAAENRAGSADRLLSSLRAFGVKADDYEAATMDPVTIPLCEALQAYGQGDFDGAVERLLPLRHDLTRIGGSHAQRDVFVQFLVEAAIRGGRLTLARALLAERTLHKARSHGTWTKYATVLEQLDDHAGAAAARNRAGARPSA